MSAKPPENDAQEGSSGSGDTPSKVLNLDKLVKKYHADSVIGPVTIRRLTMSDHIELEKADESKKLEAPQLTNILIERTVKHSDNNEPLAPAEIDRLSADADFLEELIKGHPDLTDFGDAGEPGELGEPAIDPDRVKPAVREEGESADAYLLRAWRAYHRHFAQTFSGIGEALRKQLSGLTGALSTSGLQSLMKNAAASRSLQGAIDRASVSATPSWLETFEEKRFEPIRLPPNPIHKTNEHLNELVASIDQMRELAVSTAEMQRGLNDVATEILDKFVTGARTAEKASNKNLLIAQIGIGIAVVSVLITLGVSVAQLAMSGPSKSEIAHMRRMEALARSSRDESTRQRHLLEQVVELDQARMSSASAQKASSTGAAKKQNNAKADEGKR